MTLLKKTNLALSVLLWGSALLAVAPVQAQPMTGDAPHQDHTRMHERMTQHWEKRQTELKAKLRLVPTQESAWNTFVQAMKPQPKPSMATLNRNELAKLTTPERLDKMNAIHEANLKEREAHMKQRTEATREFYNQLNAEQRKVFDAETLHEPAQMEGRGSKGN